MGNYLPYVVSVLCALISGVTSYSVARKQGKADIEKLEKIHELNLKSEKEKHALEVEKLELEHKHQIELQQKGYENQLGSDVMNTVFSEMMKMPDVKRQFAQGMNNSKKHK